MVYEILRSSLVNMWPSIVILTVTLISIRIAYLTRHKESFKLYKDIWLLLSIIYMILLYQMVTKVDTNTIAGFNLTPFEEITRYKFGSELFFYNVLGNIALFIPFGYIVASYVKPKKIWVNTFVSMAVSATIEFVQYYIGRSFDIDDIILNTVGCIIGFLLFVGIQAIKRHLPGFMKSNWFNNLFCIIILIGIILYILRVMGIVIL